jgi:hypothetical protein
MSRKYYSQRTEEIRKKNEKKKIKENPKIVITNEINCNNCGKFSGWTNDDLRYISGEREIKCTNCGKPCIQTLCKKRNISNNE